MDYFKKYQEELNILRNEMKAIKAKLTSLELEKNSFLVRQQQVEKSLYKKNIALCHLGEILRIADLQFSRLRKKSGLIQADLDELNKWIGRVKTEDGLKDIVDALNELEKYSPGDIKTNLYALVQKIIIEGAYKQKRK